MIGLAPFLGNPRKLELETNRDEGMRLTSPTSPTKRQCSRCNLDVALVLSIERIRRRLSLMMMVEYFADSTACALRDLACTLGSADSDVLAGDRRTLADVACGLDWVKSHKVSSTLPDTLGRRSGALCGPFADVSGASAHVATRAALIRLLLARRLRCVRRLGRSVGRSLGVVVLPARVLAAQAKSECEKHDKWL